MTLTAVAKQVPSAPVPACSEPITGELGVVDERLFIKSTRQQKIACASWVIYLSNDLVIHLSNGH